ncbi:PAS domain-containing sensor histidine kinase [Flammeovirga kamogawensis]|uniref:histidine kinase n=1 Tax=Flammeovirga kamogawensis TaxID=373891 RepID=A0ABX8GTM3_9BACT|nr:PAS domain S-box protein [Flammeovirga kamogawensis]MBB6463970.1 PAS domain S-box-containing protein [Flammeovirga kamogawensis]QWG06597.1 PAS domain S-box protein [Flammeovirga kamogawensis]TRX68421.1 PAS domain S-box protein [Flammeovirga kamogawensis]
MTKKDQFYNNLLRIQRLNSSGETSPKEFMESLLLYVLEYEQAFYGSICKIEEGNDIVECVSRFNKKIITLPETNSFVNRVIEEKKIIKEVDQYQLVGCPFINDQTNEVFGVMVLITAPKYIDIDHFALEQAILVGEGVMSNIEVKSPSVLRKQLDNSIQEKISFKPFFTDSANLCTVTDPDSGDFVYLNQSWVRTLGFSIEELKSYPFVNWLHQDDISETIRVFQDVCEGKSIRSFINRYRTKWGEYRYLEWDASLIAENGLIYGMAKDITKQHENHEKLFFQSTILRGVQDSVLVIDLKGNVSFVNDAVIALTGYPRTYLLGRPLDVILKGFDRSKSLEVTVDDFLKDDNNIELHIGTRNGVYIWVEVRTSILYDVYGDAIGYLGIIKDITPRKEYEDTLMKRNEALSKANKELDNFVYRVSHDLRAPITSALGLIELSMTATPEEVKEYLMLQQRSLTKLDGFIHDILNYSRNNRMELRPTKVNIEELLKSTIDQYKFINNYAETLISINVETENDLYCDESRLAVILNNIISNAYKFTSIRPNASITINAHVISTDLIMKISDNGIGIREQHLNKIFDMFYRATDVNNGSGLGLYIVHEAVKKLGGEIAVQSVLNHGTTFDIVIPNLWSIFPKEIKEERATN